VSIVEQAVRRLEELRRSGIEPPAGVAQGRPAAIPLPSGAPVPAPAKVVPPARRVELPPGRASRTVNIDFAQLAAAGYLTPETPRARIADEFRVVKRPLLANVQSMVGQSRANLIMVSSSLPGEGKTFVSLNLAISLAMELDKTVLLVDADVSRPSVLKRLGLPQSAGLMDVLTDPALGVSDVMLRTNIPKLSLLPAGRPQGRATELLASDAMQRLLDELATRYEDRILVFDTPPLLPSTESRVLAMHMGQVVLVVEADHTSQKTLEQSLATLEECPNVMLLLNKISRSEVGSYYGYYAPTEV
jgi:receptor protein-tyrosine kinase